MSFNLRLPVRRIAFGLLLALCGAGTAMADDQRAPKVAPLATYQQECASCHVAFPPGMLPAESWQRLMNKLPRHYGTDASLDPETVKQISTWLTAHAGTYKRVRDVPPEDRITRSPWFVREHREVPAASWKLPTVKSPANCTACHIRADQGDFNEHDVRIPR